MQSLSDQGDYRWWRQDKISLRLLGRLQLGEAEYSTGGLGRSSRRNWWVPLRTQGHLQRLEVNIEQQSVENEWRWEPLQMWAGKHSIFRVLLVSVFDFRLTWKNTSVYTTLTCLPCIFVAWCACKHVVKRHKCRYVQNARHRGYLDGRLVQHGVNAVMSWNVAGPYHVLLLLHCVHTRPESNFRITQIFLEVWKYHILLVTSSSKRTICHIFIPLYRYTYPPFHG